MISWNVSYFKIPADIPHALYCGPGLNETLDDRPGDDETIIGADQDIPRIKKVHLLSPCQVPLEQLSLMSQHLGHQYRSQAEEEGAQAQDDNQYIQQHDQLEV